MKPLSDASARMIDQMRKRVLHGNARNEITDVEMRQALHMLKKLQTLLVREEDDTESEPTDEPEKIAV